MKVLFFGTPPLSVPYLDWLTRHHEVVGVVCKPDEPVGRGYKITPPPPKVFAQGKKIPVFQPEGPWNEGIIKDLKSLGAEVGVAVAYGRFLPDSVIQIPKMGTFNIHFSLLPKYRGAAPMQWSLINGDKETGVTAFWIVKEMDAGDICHQEKIEMAPDEDAPSLKEKLITLGIKVMEKVLRDLGNGIVIREPQKGEPSLAPMLKKGDGEIHWEKPAVAIAQQAAGMAEWPGAWTHYAHEESPPKQLKIMSCRANAGASSKSAPGEIIGIEKEKGIVVQTGEGQLLLEIVQPEGRKTMPAWAFWQGARMKVGDRFQ